MNIILWQVARGVVLGIVLFLSTTVLIAFMVHFK